jgi:pimeloyl-ACP methyl ester carboxylesterase
MLHESKRFAGVCLVAATTWVAAVASHAGDTLRSFEPGERTVVDENALWSPCEKFRVAQVEAYHSFLDWLEGHVPVPPEVAGTMVVELKDAACLGRESSEPAGSVADIWLDLVKKAPESLTSEKSSLTLTVLGDDSAPPVSLGGGEVIVGELFCDALIDLGPSGRPSLAFALARAIGHDCLGHSLRQRQGEWAKKQFSELRVAGVRAPSIGKSGQGSNKSNLSSLRSSYSLDDEAAADLFAIHLCRFAGFDTEGALDLLRSEVVEAHPEYLTLLPKESDQPPLEPEFVENTPAGSLAKKEIPSPINRLRRLRVELDGLCNRESYGLFSLDVDTGVFAHIDDDSLASTSEAIVFVHGMESNLAAYLPLAQQLRSSTKAADPAMLFFQYPNDGSLAHAGAILSRELLRTGVPKDKTDFVCHSAGGLVVRYYTEVLEQPFRRLCFQGTPHAGSNLAGLRTVLEAKQFLFDMDLGHSNAMQRTILDGRGQISIDLTPGSIFLQHLNDASRMRDATRYFVQRGRKYSRPEALVRKGAFAALKKTALATFRSTYPKGANAFTDAAANYLNEIELPAEVVSGDLCVTLESAGLPGVTSIKTYDGVGHTELPADKKVVEDLLAYLGG